MRSYREKLDKFTPPEKGEIKGLLHTASTSLTLAVSVSQDEQYSLV